MFGAIWTTKAFCVFVQCRSFHCKYRDFGADSCDNFHFCRYLFCFSLTKTFHLFWDCIACQKGMAREANKEMDCWGWSWACGELGGCAWRSVFNLNHVQRCKGRKALTTGYGHTFIVLSVSHVLLQPRSCGWRKAQKAEDRAHTVPFRELHHWC